MEKKRALIVGGTSGLGLELARLLSGTHNVIITGRHEPKENPFAFIKIELTNGWLNSNQSELIATLRNFREHETDRAAKRLGEMALEIRKKDIVPLPDRIGYFVRNLPYIDLLIYAAGFFQEKPADGLGDAEIMEMNDVGLQAPELLLSHLLRKQNELDGFIAITSTSQWTPRRLELPYTGVKAGLAMIANSLSKDPRVGKVMVAGPAGMKTDFYRDSSRDMSTMLDPKFVAQKIIHHYGDEFVYRFLKILREPMRCEIVETREKR